MRFNYAYNGNSSVSNTAGGTGLSFSPDLKREPTYFSGELRKKIEFREAISALHDVVVSDMRYQPRDKTEYLAWAAKQEEEMWGQVEIPQKEIQKQIEVYSKELHNLNNKLYNYMRPYYQKREKYYKYLYRWDYNAWFVFDPVITVHPDQVFFECFSQDESSYGRLSANYEVFQNIGEHACGTTNVDYSTDLYNEFQKIRTYKKTDFNIDPSGFEVQTTNEESYKEVKIDLPDSWVRGFLQVNSAMCMPMKSFTLHPMDIHNLCFVLRRQKEMHGPRSLRFQLKPGAPVRIIAEPWNHVIECTRSIYPGDTEEEIRLWGRRRLHILERLIPIAKSFTVHLLGTGMPSFFVADLGDMKFTLGLSGWTANDWSQAGNFDLMAPRADVDDMTKQTVFSALKENWYEKTDSLASRIKLDRTVVLGALSAYAQAGRAIYDLGEGVYRVRELTLDPLPLDQLRFANPREEAAARFLKQNAVTIVSAQRDTGGALHLNGTVQGNNKSVTPTMVIDADERLAQGECSCSWYIRNKLYKGPCEHMLALRMFFARQKAENKPIPMKPREQADSGEKETKTQKEKRKKNERKARRALKARGDRIYCKECSAENLPESKFCCSCGKNMGEYKACPGCSKLMPKDDRFCPHCGL